MHNDPLFGTFLVAAMVSLTVFFVLRKLVLKEIV